MASPSLPLFVISHPPPHLSPSLSPPTSPRLLPHTSHFYLASLHPHLPLPFTISGAHYRHYTTTPHAHLRAALRAFACGVSSLFLKTGTQHHTCLPLPFTHTGRWRLFFIERERAILKVNFPRESFFAAGEGQALLRRFPPPPKKKNWRRQRAARAPGA